VCGNVFLEDAKVQVTSIGLTADYIYWASIGAGSFAGSIWRAPLNGTAHPQVIVKGINPTHLIADTITMQLFWMDKSSGLYTVRAAPFTDLGAISNVTTAEPNVEWRAFTQSLAGPIFWADVTNQVIFKLGESAPHFNSIGAPLVIASDADELFWFDGDSIDRGLVMGGGRAFVSGADSGTWGVAVDDNYVYWSIKGSGGYLTAKPKDSQDNFVVIASGQPYPTHVFADGNNVYWVNEVTEPCGTPVGVVSRVPAGIEFSPPEILASDVVCPSNFVMNGSHVYWGGGSKIYRAER
jgi:hypothetical protein